MWEEPRWTLTDISIQAGDYVGTKRMVVVKVRKADVWYLSILETMFADSSSQFEGVSQ